MNGAFYIAATGLRSQETALEAHANNIANMNTPGFKRSEILFSELTAQRAQDAASAAPLGVAAQQSSRVFDQGDLRRTDNPVDLAIDGRGFIEVLGPNGRTYLSRGGRFRIDGSGQLTTPQGLPLKSLATIADGAFTVDAKGVVRAASDSERILGRLELVLVQDTGSLKPIGDGLYEIDGADLVQSAEPGADGAGQFVQGALEGSNVRLSDEMVTLLLMQRSFAANSQVVQAADQLMSIANGLIK